MLDPKTLKIDDVVIFGEEVEMTVSETFHVPADANVYFYDGGDETAINRKSPLWHIAKIKRPELPGRLFTGGVLTVKGEYKIGKCLYDPARILGYLTKDVESLVAAGVEVSE